MKKYQTIVAVWFFVVISTTVVIQQMRTKPLDPLLAAKQSALNQAKLDLQLRHLERNDAAMFYGSLSLVGVLGLSALIVATGVHRERVKRASVHTYEIGGNKVVILERDLPVAWRVVTDLTTAEGLKALAPERAFELLGLLTDIRVRELQALFGKRGLPLALPQVEPAPVQVTPASIPAAVPSFQELLQRGEIAPGKPMILGFVNGQPRRGSFLDIYSSAVAGESGSGKTGTLLFLIGGALIAEGCRFIGIDPHYPHPKSLGFKTRALWEQGIIEMATTKQAMYRSLQCVNEIIDRRLRQADASTQPVVLVLDELSFLATQAIRPTLFRVMERVSTEGRKCAVYMLASSHTWLAKRLGGDSVVRDTLTSAYVHRIKPKQAGYLLQNGLDVEKIKGLKHPGDVLLCPVHEESVICRVPYATERDMAAVAELCAPNKTQVHQVDSRPDSLRPRPGLRELERATGIKYSTLRRHFKEGKTLNQADQATLAAYLRNPNQGESGGQSSESEDESGMNQPAAMPA